MHKIGCNDSTCTCTFLQYVHVYTGVDVAHFNLHIIDSVHLLLKSLHIMSDPVEDAGSVKC